MKRGKRTSPCGLLREKASAVCSGGAWHREIGASKEVRE